MIDLLVAITVVLGAYALGWNSCRVATIRRIQKRLDAAERRLEERMRSPPS